MTIVEFSKKYHVKYSWVFEATYGLEYTTRRSNSKQYDENELRHCVAVQLRERRLKTLEQIDSIDRMLMEVLR